MELVPRIRSRRLNRSSYVPQRRGGGGRMACGWLLAVILTVAITPSGANPEATITFNPPNLTLTAQQIDKGEGRVNVTCVATSNDTTQLSELRINRFDAALKPKVMLAQASSDLHNGIAHLHDGTDLHNRAQVFGSVAEGSITVTVDRVTCGDVTKYTCLVKYAARKTRQQSRRLAVNVTPGPLTLTASPEVATLRHVDDVITMTCEGPLGTVSKHQQPRWVWEYRHTYDVNAPWALYHASPGEVTSGPMVQRACYARGSTTLKRRLTMADSERQYRCYVATDWVSYSQYAASWSVGTLRSAGDHSINQGLMVGLGVGGCVGVVVGLLVVLAAGLVLLVWRRRQLAARKTQTVNCPLLPPHRHAAWYGEYLEPVVCVPQQQQQQQQQQYQQEDDQTGIYSEIPEQLCPDKKPPPFSPPPPPSAVKGQIA